MTVSALSAARTLCELRDWQISNLELQKILYLAHMFYLGDTGEPLVHEEFQAWEYGPVIPEVYRHAKGFGSDRVRNVFHWIDSVPEGTPEYEELAHAAEGTKDMSSGQLVAATHWKNGAWSEYYRPNQRGIVIPNSAILQEYKERERAVAEKS